MWTTERSYHSPYGLRRGDLALDLLVLDDPALLEVDEEQLPGASRPLRWMCSGATVITPVSEASTT